MTTAPRVFFILGGPGSGKGTNCDHLVEEFGYTHLSAGDLLRAEVRSSEGELGKMIDGIIKRGEIVPSEITVELLRRAIETHPNPHGYLVDGFPRKEDQARMFEEGIARAKAILYFDCTEETMAARVLSRSAGGAARADDNAETMRTRFRVNVEECMPVVGRYKQETPCRCHVIDANATREDVYAKVRRIFLDLGEQPLTK